MSTEVGNTASNKPKKTGKRAVKESFDSNKEHLKGCRGEYSKIFISHAKNPEIISIFMTFMFHSAKS